MANKSESKKYHFIYKTTNLINGKFYIGMHSTNNLKDDYLGSGTYLRRSIKKHGKENFYCEVLEFIETREALIEREKEIINEELLKDSFCMNLILGGKGFSPGKHQQECAIKGGNGFAARLRQDERFRLEHKIRVSKNASNSHKEGKLRHDGFKNKKHTKETKQKQSLAKKGKYKREENSQYGTCWITNEIENKKIKKEDLIPEGWRLGRKINSLMV